MARVLTALYQIDYKLSINLYINIRYSAEVVQNPTALRILINHKTPPPLPPSTASRLTPRSRHALLTYTRRIILIHIQQTAPAAKLLPVARTQHITTTRSGRSRRARQTVRAIALLTIFDPCKLHRRTRSLAEIDARLDRHARRIRIGRPAKQTAVWTLVIAALGNVVAHLRNSGGRLVSCQVVKRQ